MFRTRPRYFIVTHCRVHSQVDQTTGVGSDLQMAVDHRYYARSQRKCFSLIMSHFFHTFQRDKDNSFGGKKRGEGSLFLSLSVFMNEENESESYASSDFRV